MFVFRHDYDTEEKRALALLAMRYPDGFICTECANTTYCCPRNKPGVLQCTRCRYQTVLTPELADCPQQTGVEKAPPERHPKGKTRTGVW
jgi:ribosomal protein L37AE/L43A